MATMLETPSRIWRRIEAVEGRDMPSLPSLPGLEDSEDATSQTTDEPSLEDIQESLPLQSTPAPLSARTNASTIRPPSSTSSTVRFAHSIASRASKSSMSASNTGSLKHSAHESFDISAIPSLPGANGPEVYISSVSGAELNGDMSGREISDALQSDHPADHSKVEDGKTPSRKYDYSVSLRSERQPSPFDKLRNVSFRRPLTRARTPSLTSTTPSPTSSSSHSTTSAPLSPFSALSIPLPPSTNASPSGEEAQETRYYDTQTSINIDEQSGLANSVSGDAQSHAQTGAAEDRDSSREPTFSSEEAPNMSEAGTIMPAVRSPASVAFSSPAPSAMFTPTPVFQPRPRARFALPQPTLTPQQQQTEHDEQSGEAQSEYQQGEDPATPGTHKRSFLLSVINSTARPKMKWATPHPHRAGSNEDAQATGPTQPTPGVSLRAAFAGVTTRPPVPRRLSHPLSQAWSGPSEEGVASGSESTSGSTTQPQSPYDPTIDRASFVSTGSAHDLTTHARANASFDPVIGLGEHGHGVGRFNANKLNNYLHGLNRRLQEENETLMARLKEYEERFGKDPQVAPDPPPAPQLQARRPSGSGRRVSMGPELGDVAEDIAEGWIEEKAALEDAVDNLKQKLEQCAQEKDKVEGRLKEQLDEREMDKERWRERMKEVERGVEKIVQDLEARAEEAEQAAKKAEEEKIEVAKASEKQLVAIIAQSDALAERLQKAESALEGGKDLGMELIAANERAARLGAELQNAKGQITALEEEVMQSDIRIDVFDKELRDTKAAKSQLQDDLKGKTEQLSDAMQRIQVLNEDMQKVQDEMRKAKAYIAQMDTDAVDAVERIETLEKELADLQDEHEILTLESEDDKAEIERLSDEANKAAELSRQLEEALKAAESKMLTDEQELLTVKGRLAALERSAERSKDLSRSVSSVSRSTNARQTQPEIEALAKVEALQLELEDAHREVARLSTLLNQSPARKAIEKAKDAKISQLEQEKEDLAERLKSMRPYNTLPNTPGKMSNMSGMSPMHRQLLTMTFKSPKTPGGPLQDLSWLHSTMNDPTMSPLVAEIARLQQQLDRANESIDDKLDKLGDAGLDVVTLTKRLEEARARIISLGEEIAKLTRLEDKRSQRLRKVRCSKCLTKIDVQAAINGDESTMLEASRSSLPSHPPTPPTKSTEALRASVEALNVQLVSMKKAWDEEKRTLLGEKAVLQDTANKLNAKVRDVNIELQKHIDAERAGEKARAGMQGALDNAERMVQDLEGKLKAERAQLKSFSAEHARYQREKEEISRQLGMTESAMAKTRDHLQRLKKDNHDLEAELRVHTTAEQKARLLESKISANVETIEQLRHERSILASDHKDLQQRFKKMSEHVQKLRDEHAASQTSHDNRRHELELQRLELDDLRRAYSQRGEELARAESERKRVAAEKADIAQSVAVLQADLKRVRQEADAYGRDLKNLHMQKETMEEARKDEKLKLERAQRQAQTQIRLLQEELEGQRQKASALLEEKENHHCIADSQQLVSLKERHKDEARGLLVHIRYLKAAFARESTRCSHLSEQKLYLLKLLGRVERNEQRILVAIATVGFAAPKPSPAPRLRKLKALVQSVIFINRTRLASEQWRHDKERRPDVLDALQDVRNRRTTSVADGN
ncbi:hypothetical protein OBBRIDRAFT_891971 [Obba rivulosa]|uniref:Pericentrin/AKAP-450 centrosomal targeting domain-containing protein n=1 Tax=Obba rivulosa TaxID=1052685 RepID=A0A8E2DDU5_9APHY|nr:hypothetical protein OBBRIDRAFT_891971 [Obba rivulosa]